MKRLATFKTALAAPVALALALIAPIVAAQDGADEAAPYTRSAVFAGGCFWCVEADFEKLDGVGDVVSGYTGGILENPTYENHVGHVEAAMIPYDPEVISYRELVDYLLRHIDPFDGGGQFCDRGHSYTSAIFAETADEWEAANAAIEAAKSALGAEIVTPVVKRTRFWKAEDYHQDYHKKNPFRYRLYRTSCGRDARVKRVWAQAESQEQTGAEDH